MKPYTLFVLLSLAAGAVAQTDQPQPLTIGGFTHEGSITSAFRFTDVNGYKPMYREMFGLEGGFRVTDFSLFGRAKEGTDRFADDYSLTLSGLGGDPFTTAQFSMRKNRHYELRANFREFRYYWNRNDAVSSNGFTGITSYHDWATVRKMGSFHLAVYATNNLRFHADYSRSTRDGVSFTTRTLDYFGSSSTWGAFARANPYYLIAPLNENSDRVSGGVDYSNKGWNFHYTVGYQRFDDSVNGSLPTSPERSINVNDATTAVELASLVSWSDYRKFNTPVSEFTYDGKITPQLEARGSYLFYRYRGPASLDMAAAGVARTNTAGTLDAPYTFSTSARAINTEPNHVIDQGFTYTVKDWWRLLFDYRYSRFTVDSTATFKSTFGPTVTSGTSSSQWKIGSSTFDFKMAFAPTRSLLVNAGVRYMKSDVENFQDGVLDFTRTRRIKSVWPVLTVFYRPTQMVSIRADIEEINNGTSYTRITPHTDIGGRLIARVRPIERLSIENSLVARNRRLLAADYHNRVRSNATTVAWEWNSKLSIFGGFSYESLFTSDFTTFLRGTGPLTNSIRGQTVNRVWQSGVDLRPVERLSIQFAGNYVRTTGLAEIGGEPPLYGPMTFPYATGSVKYDVPKIGKLGVELQRTYYIEEITTANNFGAKLLTVVWSRTF